MVKRFRWENELVDEMSKHWKLLAIFFITTLAVVIRVSNFPFLTDDYVYCLKPWTEYLADNGHFKGMASLLSITNYGAPYLYILSLISYLPKSMYLYAIKIVSCVFDFVCAIYVAKIVTKITQKENIGILAYGMVLFWPTVFTNSSMWAQCDALYASFAMMMLWSFMEEKPKLAMVFYGFAFSFKLQATFLFPLLIILYIYKKWSIIDAAYGVGTWLLLQVPSWLFGVPLSYFITVYIGQSRANDWSLIMNAPSVYALLPDTYDFKMNQLLDFGEILSRLGVVVVMIVFILLAVYLLKENRKLTAETLILLVLFSGSIVPYLLPRMHDRYFFIADIAVIIYILLKPKRWWIALLVTFPSCMAYTAFLFKAQIFDMFHMSIIMGIACIFITKWLLESIQTDPKQNEEFRVEMPIEKQII